MHRRRMRPHDGTRLPLPVKRWQRVYPGCAVLPLRLASGSGEDLLCSDMRDF